MTTSKNHENYWKVDFQIDILEEACETASHIVNCHRTACMPAHAHKCMHMRFAWWAMLGSLFPNMACPNSDGFRIFFFFFFQEEDCKKFTDDGRRTTHDARRTTHDDDDGRKRTAIFLSFFFFLRVSQMSFLKLRVTRATRAFYTGEKHECDCSNQ